MKAIMKMYRYWLNKVSGEEGTDMIYRLTIIVLSLVVILSGASFATDKQFDTGVSATWFKDDNSNKGTQLSIPLRAGFAYEGFKAQLLNALVYTSLNPDQGSSVSLSRFLDTKINLSYEILGRPPVDYLLGCGFNLPTGYTNFKADKLALVSLPPDLLPITAFGEGLNINPYLGVSKEWTRLAAGFGMGYQWRGEYDYSEFINELNPGDVLTLTAEATYSLSDELQGRLFSEYARYGKDKVDGREYYREGALKLMGIGATYSMASCQLDADLNAIYRDKGKYYIASSTPMNDEKNYGDEWQVGLKYKYFLNTTTSVKSHLGFLTISENGFQKDSLYYAGGRQKISLGGGMEKDFTKNIKGNVDLNLFTLKDKKNWNHPGEDLSYKGFTLSGGLNMAF
jgi:hypothetical protein